MQINKYGFYVQFLWLVLALVVPISTQAQKESPKGTAAAPQVVTAVSIRDDKLNSKLMARNMPYRIALPSNYVINNQERYPVIYLLHGLTGHYDNWGDKTKIAEYLAPYNVIVVMPEGNNGWYTDSATVTNDRYETYITQELIPEIDKNFRTIPVRKKRVIAGLSMGGYGSIKFGLKNPEMFGLVGSFSGALGAASWSEKLLGNSGTIATTIMSVYGAENSQTRMENDIFKIVGELPADKVKNLPFIYLDCGTEDFLILSNRDFLSLLNEKKIRHEYRELPGGHTWSYWETQIQDFLRLSDRFLKTQNKQALAENSFSSGETRITNPVALELVKKLPVKRSSLVMPPVF